MGNKPILILGAGISGLILAQHLRRIGVPFVIFDRDEGVATRGLGWALTLHWSLPALRSLLPDDLVQRIPETYVDRAAVAEGRASRFPFFDLSTGELKATTPTASTDTRIRVSREKFRRLLATGLDIQWSKAASAFHTFDDGSVRVYFDDGSSSDGSLVVACDGGNSRIRRQLLPGQKKHEIPIGLVGLKLQMTPEEIEPLRELDTFFLQGTSSEDNSYIYFSILDAPRNDDGTNSGGNYTCQIVVSWSTEQRSGSSVPVPSTDEESVALIKQFASNWAEPFRSLILTIPPETATQRLNLTDWPPPQDLRTSGHVALVGDALHPMAMYRGEGANHAIVDVLDFVEIVMPYFAGASEDKVVEEVGLRNRLDEYESKVVARTRPAVLASRRACLDAHDWKRINAQSPLLSKRAMYLDFDENNSSV